MARRELTVQRHEEIKRRYVGGVALQAADEPSFPSTAAQENLPL
jgi:hypothetical protein